MRTRRAGAGGGGWRRASIRAAAVIRVAASIWVLFASAPARTNEPPALHVEASHDSITVGDHLILDIWLEVDADTAVELPDPAGDLGDLELRTARPTVTETRTPGTVRHRSEWTVTAFRVGPARLPPLAARVGEGERGTTVTSDTLTITVTSLLVAAGADSLADIRELQGLIDLPVPLDWRRLAVVVLVGLLLLLGWLYWRHRRRRRAPAPRRFGRLDLRSPAEWALAELAQLRQAELPRQAASKEHYTRITEIMRPYIEGRFRVHAADRTTAEIMTLMGGCTDPAYSDDQADRLATLFAEADLVKFARLEPAVPAAMAALEQAVAFVEATARARELGEAGDPTGAGGATGPRGPAVTAPTESEVEP